MKRGFLVAALALMVGCTQDFEESTLANEPLQVGSEKLVMLPEGASKGMLAIKFDAESVRDVEQHVTRSNMTRSGLVNLDMNLDQIAATRFERIFNDPMFEESLRKAGLHCWYKVSFPEEVALEEAALALAAHPEVQWVEFMHPLKRDPMRIRPVELSEATRAEGDTDETEEFPQDDPMLKNQWHYDNRGGVEHFVEGADINLFDAWKLCMGDENVVVAIVDEPVQLTHPDLKPNLWVNTYDSDPDYKYGANFCTPRSEPIEIEWEYDSDGQGNLPVHGSHVAGVVAAVNGNGEGVCGIAGGQDGVGGARLMICQVFSYKDNVAEASSDALVWAAHRGAQIAQCSFGYGATTTLADWSRSCSYEREAIDYFIEYERTSGPLTGGVVIFAAGNDGNTVVGSTQIKDLPMAPAAYSKVLSVSSIGPDIFPANYTNYGYWTDVSAPGGSLEVAGTSGMILSTLSESNYGYLEGTSMACPHASGVAALGLSYAQKLGKQFTAKEFMSLLRSATNDVDDIYEGTRISTAWKYTSTGNFYGDTTEVYLDMADYKGKMGNGLIDAFRLLMLVEGTPILTVGKGEPMLVPTVEYLGGMATSDRVLLELLVDEQVEQQLGLTYTVEGGMMHITCANTGSAVVELKAQMVDDDGETLSGSSVTMRMAIICRNAQAANGGWL